MLSTNSKRVVFLQNGANRWVFLHSPGDLEHICATNTRNYTARYLPDIYRYITHDKGILGSQGERRKAPFLASLDAELGAVAGSSGDYNRQHRKMCHPAFHRHDILERFATIVTDRTEQLADALASASPNGRFKIFPIVQTPHPAWLS